MIKHIVMFKFKEEANGKTKAENLIEARAKMMKLKDEIPEILEMQVYIGEGSAPDTNYDYALVSEFESMETLNSYQVHPAHVAFGKYIGELRELRACMDYEI